MAGIWTNTGERWELSSPQAFQDEATLHGLIEKNPQFLPLAGSPRLTILGSEIQLGSGYADLLAVESSGRPTIIEVKLASNPESRRAIVSQVIAYAAFLQGSSLESLEQGPLRRSLSEASYGSILEAVQAEDQEGAIDSESFPASMQEFLDQGNFRLVLVLDEVSAELARVVAYLDAITVQALTIDLITLEVYEIQGAQVALPQRISPDASSTLTSDVSYRTRPSSSKGTLLDGPSAFKASIEATSGETRATFDELIAWAERLASLPRVRLYSYSGDRHTLLPYVMPDKVGLVTIWNDNQRPYVSVWRSVFERLAPKSVESIEQTIAPAKFGQGNYVQNITKQFLDAVETAYQETGEG